MTLVDVFAAADYDSDRPEEHVSEGRVVPVFTAPQSLTLFLVGISIVATSLARQERSFL